MRSRRRREPVSTSRLLGYLGLLLGIGGGGSLFITFGLFEAAGSVVLAGLALVILAGVGVIVAVVELIRAEIRRANRP